tara:strand:+ start:81 stop:509 length:429 start_codon:yes stop_codon:yes gene_type:complete
LTKKIEEIDKMTDKMTLPEYYKDNSPEVLDEKESIFNEMKIKMQNLQTNLTNKYSHLNNILEYVNNILEHVNNILEHFQTLKSLNNRPDSGGIKKNNSILRVSRRNKNLLVRKRLTKKSRSKLSNKFKKSIKKNTIKGKKTN